MDAPGPGSWRRRPLGILGVALLRARRWRAWGALGVVVLGAGLLGGCATAPGGTAAARVLTGADFPASLPLVENHSSVARRLAQVFRVTYPGCAGRFAVFTEGGRTPSPVSTGTTIFPEVFSESSACPNAAGARTVFQKSAREVEAAKVGGTAISGFGDAAVIARIETGRADEYALFWRDGAVLGFIQLSGPTGDGQISAAGIEALARRQIADDRR